MASRRIDPRSSRGASAVEYALIISGFAAVLVLAVFTVGRVAGDQIAKGGSCLTTKVCTAAPATATPSATATASATPTPATSSAAPVATATPTPSSTRSSGSGSGSNGSGNNGRNNNRDD